MQGGFRGDWTLSAERTLTVQGDAYTTRLGERVVIDMNQSTQPSRHE